MKSVEQLVNSYYTAKAVVLLRKDLKEHESEKIYDFLINNLKVENSIQKDRAIKLIENFSKLIGYQLKPIKILILLIEDIFFYEFDKVPSVNTGVAKDFEYLNKTFGSDYVELKKINLLEHTLNVFEESLELLKYYRPSQVLMPSLGALLHDFGKSDLIRKEILSSSNTNSKEFKAHQIVSGLYIQNILKYKFQKKYNENIDDFLKILKYIVENHHPATKKISEEFNISLVKNADYQARQKELIMLNK